MSKTREEMIARNRAVADLLEANPWLFTPPEFTFDFGPEHFHRVCRTADEMRDVVARLADVDVKHENLKGTLYVSGTVDGLHVMATCSWDVLMPAELTDDERRKVVLASLLAPSSVAS